MEESQEKLLLYSDDPGFIGLGDYVHFYIQSMH